MNIRKSTASLAMALALVLLLVVPAAAYANSLTYSGQGVTGGSLDHEVCGITNGAPVDGPYLQWNLTATSSNNADITGPWGTATMTKSGSGAFKYISGWYDLSTLPGNVTATYDVSKSGVQLTIGAGCPPSAQGAWCSPGFWRNADDAAWTLVGVSKSAFFNATVVPNFYATASGNNPTLWDVLTYSGPGGADYYGAADSPYGLNAFNATGAFLTDNVPGFEFDPALVGPDDSVVCPIDHHGDYK